MHQDVQRSRFQNVEQKKKNRLAKTQEPSNTLQL